MCKMCGDCKKEHQSNIDESMDTVLDSIVI